MLSDALLTENNRQMNRILYSQLDVVKVGDTGHHLVKSFEDTNNGNAAWKSMCE